MVVKKSVRFFILASLQSLDQASTNHSEYVLTVNGLKDTPGNTAIGESENYSILGCFP